MYTSIHVAHELRAWLLHYSPVVLHGILLVDYYQHHLLLVEGIYLLLKQLCLKRIFSKAFACCFMFSVLYGKCIIVLHYYYYRPVVGINWSSVCIDTCTHVYIYIGERQVLPNVHGLLHLPEAVSDLGPLWGFPI